MEKERVNTFLSELTNKAMAESLDLAYTPLIG